MRIYADDCGESHFVDVDVSLEPVDFAPPAAPLNVARLFPAAAWFLVAGPDDWNGAVPHPSLSRQLMCVLQGEFQATASAGEKRRFPPGAVLLLEDTMGKGHATRVVGARPFLILGVALAD